ncbi:MAG: transcription elongation factor GreA [Zavarzinella sp.]
MIEERIPMTREGYDNLKAELSQMESHLLEITRRVATAREMGDLSENAEYHAAREDQGMQQAKIDQLKGKLARATIIDPNSLPRDVVVFGCTVTIKDMDTKDEDTYQLVGPGQDDPDENKILTSSPIGRGLLGKKKGDIAEIEVPKGLKRFKILKIAFE